MRLFDNYIGDFQNFKLNGIGFLRKLMVKCIPEVGLA
jgi:hypothetical protein